MYVKASLVGLPSHLATHWPHVDKQKVRLYLEDCTDPDDICEDKTINL